VKRVAWFTAGAAAGVSGSVYVHRKLRLAVERYKPARMAKSTLDRARGRGRDLADAVREGRAAMNAKEAELRASQSARVAPTLTPATRATIDVVVVDAIEPAYGRRALYGPRRRSRR
jgi:hypothetical protein